MTRRQEADVVVIGGGVIGTAVACDMGKDGHRAILLERGHFASGASGANVGSIAVHTMGQGALLQMAISSLRSYSSLESELGWSLEYEPRGAMVIFQNGGEREYMEHMVQGQREAGLSVHMLNRGESVHFEPALGPAVLGATNCTTFAQVDTHRLTLGGARRLGAGANREAKSLDRGVSRGLIYLLLDAADRRF